LKNGRPHRYDAASDSKGNDTMILDLLEKSASYEKLHPGFAKGFEFLRRTDLAAIADGRHAIDGERVFAINQTYDTKPWKDGFLEIHRRYMDIQFIVSGEELIGYAPLAGQPEKDAYDASRDIAFLHGASDPVRLRAGQFAIFFPHDAHMPGRTTNAPTRVHKIVVKVAVA
jgi:YhcH/YjgK/YiaL family protein